MIFCFPPQWDADLRVLGCVGVNLSGCLFSVRTAFTGCLLRNLSATPLLFRPFSRCRLPHRRKREVYTGFVDAQRDSGFWCVALRRSSLPETRFWSNVIARLDYAFSWSPVALLPFFYLYRHRARVIARYYARAGRALRSWRVCLCASVTVRFFTFVTHTHKTRLFTQRLRARYGYAVRCDQNFRALLLAILRPARRCLIR